MNQAHEVDERCARIEALRADLRRIGREAKALKAEKKDAEEQVCALLDEIKDIRHGGGVQTTIGT